MNATATIQGISGPGVRVVHGRNGLEVYDQVAAVYGSHSDTHEELVGTVDPLPAVRGLLLTRRHSLMMQRVVCAVVTGKDAQRGISALRAMLDAVADRFANMSSADVECRHRNLSETTRRLAVVSGNAMVVLRAVYGRRPLPGDDAWLTALAHEVVGDPEDRALARFHYLDATLEKVDATMRSLGPALTDRSPDRGSSAVFQRVSGVIAAREALSVCLEEGASEEATTPTDCSHLTAKSAVA